jgi:hypothetical protein
MASLFLCFRLTLKPPEAWMMRSCRAIRTGDFEA